MKTTREGEKKQHTMKSNYGNSRGIRNVLRSARQKEGKINTYICMMMIMMMIE